MSEPRFPLETVETWMQAVLVHPKGAEEGLTSKDAVEVIPEEQAGEVIRESPELSAADRLGIYAKMYQLRMQEALEADYPVAAWLLGPQRFAGLVRDYVAAHPSTSFTLARLGDRVPEFLAAWGGRRHRSLLVDVARLERAASQVFDAEEAAALGAASFEAIVPADLPGTPFRTVPALAVLRVRLGAVEALDAFLEGTKPPRGSGRGTVWVVFHRQEFTVLRRSLDPFAGRLLEGFAAGETLAGALAFASRGTRQRRPAPEALSAWFREWLKLGFFRRS